MKNKHELSCKIYQSMTFNSGYLHDGKDLHELNKGQRLIKTKEAFFKSENVNTGINFSTADNESKNGNLNT